MNSLYLLIQTLSKFSLHTFSKPFNSVSLLKWLLPRSPDLSTFQYPWWVPGLILLDFAKLILYFFINYKSSRLHALMAFILHHCLFFIYIFFLSSSSWFTIVLMNPFQILLKVFLLRVLGDAMDLCCYIEGIHSCRTQWVHISLGPFQRRLNSSAKCEAFCPLNSKHST